MKIFQAALGHAALLVILWTHCVASVAEDENTQAKSKPKPCTNAESRAFDFWIGEWEVTSPPRPKWKASSSITLSNNGCSLHEAYTTPSGYTGKSINFYDAGKQRWHQTWIDNQGVPLYLEGNLVNKVMVLSDANNRVSWSVQSDGRVRQHWESTADGGKTFTTAFDGYYRRRTAD